MKKKTFNINGQVVDTNTKKEIPGLRVEAWDKDLLIDDLLGTTVTDADGRFTINFDETYYREICFDRKPDLYFKVFRKQELILSTLSTKDSIMWNVENPDIKITIPVTLTSPVIPVDYSFYRGNNWFTRRKIKLEDLTEQEHEYIAKLLNQQLHSEISKTIGEENPGLKKLFDSIPIDYREVKDSDLHTVIKEKLLAKARKSDNLEKEIENIEKAMESTETVPINGLLYLGASLKDNPVIAEDFRKAKTLEFSKIIKLDNDAALKLANKDLDLDNANEADLIPMVEEKILNEQQKNDLLLTIDLSRLSGENIELIKTLKNDRLQSMEDFVPMDREDWAKVISDHKIALPEGEESIESYAENLRLNIEKTFPTQYLLKRVIKENFNTEINLLHSTETLIKHNDTIIDNASINHEMLDWSGIAVSARPEIEKDLDQLLNLANTYRPMGLDEIINNKSMDIQQKKTAVGQRLANLDTFYKSNPNLDLYQADFFNQGAFTWAGIDEKSRTPVRKQMMAFQRTLTLTNDYEASRKLLANGFDSALKITDKHETDFLKTTGLDLEKGKAIYREAQENSIATFNAFENIRDFQNGLFKYFNVSNQGSLVNDLRQLDGFEDLFGSQDYCDCEHCKSILGPAAYFTDLMYFVHTNISQKAFLPNLANHPLYLKNRRPDLWKLKLTCQNTTTEIPYLEVVNDVLESYLIGQLGITDVYDILQNADKAITLPFNLPLEEIRLYLSHFGLKLYDIYKLLYEPQKKQLREKLGISEKELDIITTQNLYRTQNIFGVIPAAGFNVQDFINMAQITRNELDDLLNIRFLPEVAQVKVNIIVKPADIQQYDELIIHLTPTLLDLIHRFIRFWKKTGWTIREFDLVLCALKLANLLNNLEDKDSSGSPKILQVSQLVIIREALNLNIEEMCAMVDDLPDVPIEDNQLSFRERLFDLDTVLSADKTLEEKTPLLLAGLGITESELDALFTLFQIDKTQNLIIDIKLLSKLFRHVRIAKGLKISIENLINAIHLCLNGVVISQLEQIQELIDFISWQKKSVFTIPELAIILLGRESSSLKYKNDINSAVAAVLEIYKSLKPVFTLFGNQLKDTYALNETQLKALESSSYNLAEIVTILISGTDSKPIYEKDTNKLKDDVKVFEISLYQRKLDLLKSYLQRTVNLTANQLQDEFLAKLVSIDLKGSGIAVALSAKFTNDVPNKPDEFNELVTLMREIERNKLLFDNLKFDAESITFFINNPEVFGISDLKHMLLKDIKNSTFYKSLVETNKEMESKLQDSLKNYQSSGKFTETDMKILSDLWQQPASQVQSIYDTLKTVFTVLTTALPAIELLWEALQFCQQMGIKGDSLKKLAVEEADYPGLQAARDVVIGAFSSRYDDEKIRREKLEPYIDKIHTMKRDALCNYIISRRETFKFNDRSDLYKFFLLDVEMSGDFRTSRLVAAISSVQLYVHRCLVNLEQSDPDLNPSIRNIIIDPTRILIEEWEWRQNYRVWEANRKVFLYPESYIHPTLLDIKTAIFKELEDELLQEKITAESAETAYKKYMAQFAELTRLRYAGAYYHSDHIEPIDFPFFGLIRNESHIQSRLYFNFAGFLSNLESQDSVYYLFARTNTQPFQYYYRTYNHYKESWGNWEKIELSIEAEEVSALIHRGKLYIFWTEVKCKEINKIKGGGSTSGGANFNVYVKYSFRDENGKWSAPQRLDVGYSYFREPSVYIRAIENYPTEEIERDKMHDNVFEQFQRKVFRKPYARFSNNIASPIKLSYIWSQNKYVKTTLFTDGFEYKSVYEPHVSIHIPLFAFAIYKNTQFPLLITKSGFVNNNINNKKWNCKLSFDPPDCKLYISIDGKREPEYLINVWFGKLEPINIFASDFDLSLSANKILNETVLDIKNNQKNINEIDFSFLSKEYSMAYMASGTFCHYVEDGTANFTNKNRLISQQQAGNGSLSIPQTLGSLIDFVPLTTILTDELSDTLFSMGLEEFLSLRTQLKVDDNGQQLDFKGSYGQYYWEIFFHIPFLIANHLNANQKFKEAKWWYERIFNPTSPEKPSAQKPSDHNWQFREFRNLDIEKLKDILIDKAAIDAYKKDPFNPHAIARLRLNAYQKAIVMKYIDNLIDWGDHLFAQDTRESINEAEMLYQLASDILGKRPVKIGKCKTEEKKLTYETIGPLIGKEKGSEFLIMLENYHLNSRNRFMIDIKPVKTSKNLAARLGNTVSTKKVNSLAAVANAAAITRMSDYNVATSSISTTSAINLTSTCRINRYADIVKTKARDDERYPVWNDASQFKDKIVVRPTKSLPKPPWNKQYSLAFCIPPNEDLLGYWDRVDDRLFKIRNCMNISGVRRSLALFQPPIDPMLLVRARAAGLSLEDISALIAGLNQPPPYRFNYLVEKTRQFTQTVQSFGSSLLSALEKKDAEELTLLRSVHEQNILKITKIIKQKQLKEAQTQVMVLGETLTNVQNRIDYYQGLVDEGLTGWEHTQQISKHIATATRTISSLFFGTAPILFLIPQLGSPFAMKYGGKEMGDSAKAWGECLDKIAGISEAVSSSAGLEATFQRREQEWKQQLLLVKQEYKQVEKQKVAAEIRAAITEKDLEIHEKNMEQADELYEFYKNKFTNLGLYNYLSSTLNRLYREAYNLAYNMAKLAERSYQFEQDDSTIFIANDNWQYDRAGLLAGEKLMLQLQKMEQSYIEKNIRRPEITQSFSLALLDASALIKLKQTGTCEFEIPEIAFEIVYPGQYKRLIKSVRLTIPCVVGPYTNVGAKLTLLNSHVKIEDKTLIEVSIGKSGSICASSANNDAGMFEFNFRDERYLPFEGSGAVSQWRLELPSKIRAFDYNTISDVIMHISYTARDGNRDTAEADLVTAITNYTNSNGLFRLFSLKHEFPGAFHKLLSSEEEAEQKTEFSVENHHFPYFLIDRELKIDQTKVFLKPKKGSSVSLPVLPAEIKINGNNKITWNTGDDIPIIPDNNDEKDKLKGGTVTLTGSPIITWSINAGINGLNKENLDDILILVKYKI